jgi:hypothetical protein
VLLFEVNKGLRELSMAVTGNQTDLESGPSAEKPDAASRPTRADVFAGAPLDFIKLVAALFMVIDHANIVLLNRGVQPLWQFGRIAFPLFAFVLACHCLRGTRPAGYVQRLLLWGVVSQPIYTFVLGGVEGNTIFTLAVAATVITALKQQSRLLQHAVFLVGALLIFSGFVPVRSGVDYGLAGVLFPAALFLVLSGSRSHIVWLVLLLFGLNWHYPNPWELLTIQTASLAAGGAAATIAIAVALRDRPRFLPRYAFYIFYPAHLLILAAIRSLI